MMGACGNPPGMKCSGPWFEERTWAPRGIRLRLVRIGLGLRLPVLGLSTPASIAALLRPHALRVRTLYHKSRSFRIPFNVDPAERSRLKEVQLWVSKDSGFDWKPNTTTTPDRPSFTFKAAEDGEFWFAVRTLDTQGRLYPSDDEQVEPSMKVVVDTKPPSLVLQPDGRRGSGASVRWRFTTSTSLLARWSSSIRSMARGPMAQGDDQPAGLDR